MFWDRIRNELKQYGEVETYFDTDRGLVKHNNICLLKLIDKDKKEIVSIRSDKYSYGGERDLFEVSPGVLNSGDVDAFLTEDDVIREIRETAREHGMKRNRGKR